MVAALQAAREYNSKGYNVIPIQKNGKVPAINSWKEFIERQQTDLDIQGMFAARDVNLALITGRGEIVVDIDEPKLYDEFMAKWHTEKVSRTPNGGYHLYYKYPGKDITVSVSKLALGVDVRGYGGYVLEAPSCVPTKSGDIGKYLWLLNNDASPLPDDLKTTLLTQIGFKPDIQISTNEDGHQLAHRILTVGFTAGQHNVEVYNLTRYYKRMGLKDEAIYNTLKTLNENDPTPLPERELLATVKSAIGYELEKHAVVQPVVKPFAVPFWDFYSSVDRNNTEWLIDEWLPSGSLIMLAAPPEQYKTWIAFEMALQVALGGYVKPFFGQFDGSKKPENVLLVQQEDAHRKIVDRLETIVKGKWLTELTDVSDIGKMSYMMNEHLFIHAEAELSFDNPDSLTRMEKTILDKKIKLVIIDPLYTLGSTDDYFAKLATKMPILKAMREKYGVTFVLLHHTKKAGGKGRDAIWGSQLINGAMEGIWLIEEIDGKRHISRKGKAYAGEQLTKEITFVIDDDEGLYESSITDVTSILTDDGEIENVNSSERELLAAINAKPGMDRKAYWELSGMPKSTVYELVGKLVKRGLIKDEKKHLYVVKEF